MLDQIEEMESYLPYRDLANLEVSQASIAWQLDHSLKAIINLTEALQNSDPNDYNRNFNLSRTFVFTAGDFPRGVAQAPASVTPPEVILVETLIDQFATAKLKAGILQDLPENASYDHAQFGLLNRNEVARLIEVHTHHHLKIIEDILIAEGIQ